MERVSATVSAALEHQDFPFARIVRDFESLRDPSRSPIFQVMFAMERSAEIDSHGFAATLLNTEGAGITIRGYQIESVAVKRDRAQFDLTFVIEEFADSIFGVIDYRTDLWQPATIERIAQQYQAILEAIADSSDIAIDEIKIGQHSGYPLVGRTLEKYDDVIDAIHAAAEKFPSHVAVELGDTRWTYRQLMDYTVAIAAALAARGVDKNSLVAIAMSRSVEMVAAILGVLQVGAAYLPIDPSHPEARLKRVLGDASPAIVCQTGRARTPLRDSSIVRCFLLTLSMFQRLPNTSTLTRMDIAPPIWLMSFTLPDRLEDQSVSKFVARPCPIFLLRSHWSCPYHRTTICWRSPQWPSILRFWSFYCRSR